MDAAWPVPRSGGGQSRGADLLHSARTGAECRGGEGWIETLARRGYRFVGPAAALAGREFAAAKGADRRRTNLPQVLTSFVGREREIAEIKQTIAGRRAC